MTQFDNETADSFAARLRHQASFCDYCSQDCIDRNIRDQIVYGCSSGQVRKKALLEDFGLDRLLEVARAEESASACAADIEKKGNGNNNSSDSVTANIDKVSKKPGPYSTRFKARQNNQVI